MKGKMVLGGIAKEGIKIYYKKKRDKRITFYLGIGGLICLYSLITGDWQVALAGLVFSTITITADSATQFESGGAEYNAVARLADDKFIIAFRDIDDNNKGKVIIGTRSGTTITISNDSAVVFEAGDTRQIDICALDSTHFVVSYRDEDADEAKAIAGSVSGVTITLGSIVTIDNASGAKSGGICDLDSSNIVIITAKTSSTDLRVCSISGTTITVGSAQQIVAVSTGDDAMALGGLSSTKVICGAGAASSWNLRAGTVNVGAKTISFGSAVAVTHAGYNDKIAVFDENYFLLAHEYGGTYDNVTAGNVEGTTVTIGTAVTINSLHAGDFNLSVCCMDTTHFVVCYPQSDSSNLGTVRGGSISAKVVTMDADGEVVFENGNTTYPRICKLMSNYFVIALKDNN